jgi:hypothetical protein
MAMCEEEESNSYHQWTYDPLIDNKNITKAPKMPKWAMNEDIVISGIAGRYPGIEIVF